MKSTHSKFRIGIVGCGRISQTYIQALKECDDILLTKVMDIREEASISTAEETGAQAVYTPEDLVKDNDLDGVIIATPPNLHSELSCFFLSRGISVLCEKPLALTLADGLAMFRAAEKNNVCLMMASKFRYVDDLIHSKAVIASDMLGDIHFYHNAFCTKLNMLNRWNATPEISGGGVINDNGPHAFDIVNYLVGPIKKIYVHQKSEIEHLGVEDTVTISFITENNIMGTIYLSWAIELKNHHYIKLYGTEGYLKIGWENSYYHPIGHRDSIMFGQGYKKVEAFKKQISNFIRTVQGTEKPLITVEDALTSIRIIEAAYRSLKHSKWINVYDES